jgi:hypothetical protein
VAHRDSLQNEGIASKAWSALPRHLPATDACFDGNGKKSDGGIDPDPDLDSDSDPSPDLVLVVQCDLGVGLGPLRR